MSDIEDLLARYKEEHGGVVAAPPELDPVAFPALEAGKAAVEEALRRFARPAGPATIDSTVTQGNRVVSAGALVPNDPVKVLTDRVKDHYNQLSPVIGDLSALLETLKVLQNKIGVGL